MKIPVQKRKEKLKEISNQNPTFRHETFPYSIFHNNKLLWWNSEVPQLLETTDTILYQLNSKPLPLIITNCYGGF